MTSPIPLIQVQRFANRRRWIRLPLGFGVYVALGELVGRVVPSLGSLAPSRVGIALWRDRALLSEHALATTYQAAGAFVVVWLVSLFLALPLLPTFARLGVRQVVTVANALPLAALLPLFALMVDSRDLPFALAIVASIPIVSPVVDQWMAAAAKSIDESPLSLSSPSPWSRVRLLGLSAVTGPLPHSVRAGFPLCVFGATLAGFVNSHQGLGLYLAVASWQGDLSKVLAGGVVTSSLCAVAYAGASRLERMRPGDMYIAIERREYFVGPRRFAVALRRTTLALASAGIIWSLLVLVADNPFFFKAPSTVLRLSQYDEPTRRAITIAVGQTVVWSLAGLGIGFAIAVILAAISSLVPWTRWLSLPVVYFSQTVPLTVLVSLVVAVSGRGFKTALVFATSVSFFGAFLIVKSGFDRLRERYGDLSKIYGRSWVRFAVYALWPGAARYAFRGLAVAAPRAVLGTLLAEYLATRTGLGGLLYEARGRLDFNLLWLVIALATGIGIALQSVAEAYEPADDGLRPLRSVTG